MLKKLLTLTLVFVGIFALTACKDGMDDLEKIAEAMAELEQPAQASADLTFPESGLHDVTITWESDNTDVIANDGTVTIPTYTMGDQTVTVTAYITIGDNTLTKEFEIEVLAAAENDMDKALAAKASLLLTQMSGIVSDITLPATAGEATVTWASSNTDIVTDAGVVTRPAEGEDNANVTLTATITVNDAVVTKEFVVTIQAEATATAFTSIQEIYNNSVLNDYIDFTGIVSSTFSGGYFLTDGTLAIGVYTGSGSDFVPEVGDQVQVKGSYKVYNTLYQIGDIVEQTILSSDNANPLEGTEVVKTVAEMLALDSSQPEIHGLYYSVTGKIELRGSYNNIYLVTDDDALLVYYYSNEDSLEALEELVGRTVTITVVYYTDHGTNGPMVAFDGLEDDIELMPFTDAESVVEDAAAIGDLVDPVTNADDIVLPTEGPNGSTYSGWTSSNTAVLANDGAFVALGAETVVVTFTATATKGTETADVTVDVVVPLNSTVGEVLDMEVGEFFQVTGVIYDISYYGFFIEQGGDHLFVYSKQFDGAVVGDEVTMLGERNAYSGLAQVSLKSDVTVLQSGQTVPTAVESSISAIVNNVVQRGTVVTITGEVSIDTENYDNVVLTDLAGNSVVVYYRSNADAIAPEAGKVVTVTVIPYQDGLVLYSGDAAGVTVETDYTDAQKAQIAAGALEIEDAMEIITDITLPTTVDGVTVDSITWVSGTPEVVANDGTVTAVAGSDTYVTLTATVTVGTETATREIMVMVVDANEGTPMSVDEARALAYQLDNGDITEGPEVLVIGIVTAISGNDVVLQDEVSGKGIWMYDLSYDLAIGDKVVVRGVIAYADSYGDEQPQIDDVELIKEVSSDNAIIVSDETDLAVIITEHTNMETYTANLKYLGKQDVGGSDYHVFETDNAVKLILAPWRCPNWFNDFVEADMMINLTFTLADINYDHVRFYVAEYNLTNYQTTMVATNLVTLADELYGDIELPTGIEGLDFTVTWYSSNEAVVGTDGTVVRPALGEADVTVDVTAVIQIGTSTTSVQKTVTVKAEAPTLFISEYIEGGSNNKAVEIYNPFDVDVVMDGYMLALYSNGSETYGNTYDLSGITITAGGTYVVYNSGAVQAVKDAGDDDSTITYFNGDDAVALLLNGTVVDVVGVIGVDPGSNWPVGDDSTANHTLVRVATVVSGNPTWDAAEWIAYDQDTFDYLGTHTSDEPVTE